MKDATIRKIDYDTATGVQWYEVDGYHDGMGVDFENDTIGVTEDDVILDCDGCPKTESDYSTVAIRDLLDS